MLLPLPISVATANSEILSPALFRLPGNMDTPRARVQLLATALQESGLKARRQYGNGPAKGLWQFERGGGCAGVVKHFATAHHVSRICSDMGVEPTAAGVWNELEVNDVFAACMARLLYWTDGAPLPALGDADGAWALYLRTWRPGKPHPEDWPGNYRKAQVVLGL